MAKSSWYNLNLGTDILRNWVNNIVKTVKHAYIWHIYIYYVLRNMNIMDTTKILQIASHITIYLLNVNLYIFNLLEI